MAHRLQDSAVARRVLQRIGDSNWREFPMVTSVLRDPQAGAIYHSGAGEIEWMFLVHHQGFGYVALGDDSNRAFENFLSFVRESIEIPAYFHLYDFRADVGLVDAAGLNHKFRERRRYRYSGEGRSAVPPLENRLKLISVRELLVTNIRDQEMRVFSKYWRDVQDLATRSYGAGLLSGDRLISLCYAAAYDESAAEIDVVTLEEFRGRGNGKRVTQVFVDMSLGRGIQPCWDCFSDNLPSIGVAESSDFVLNRTYNFLSLHNPHR